MQGLEQGRVKGLCSKNVSSFYDNLHDMYSTHNTQTLTFGIVMTLGPKQGGMAVAAFWPRMEHAYKREWFYVFFCIHASGSSIPNFYIFKGTPPNPWI